MLLVLFFFKWISATDISSYNEQHPFSIDKIETGKIILKNKTILKTEPKNLSYIGVLSFFESLAPYFLLQAKTCDTCGSELYILNSLTARKASFLYPVKILVHPKMQIFYESEAFYGNCLHNRNPMLILYQTERNLKTGKLQSSVLIAEVEGDFLLEQFIEKQANIKHQTLQLVKKKLCFPIPQETRTISLNSLKTNFP